MVKVTRKTADYFKKLPEADPLREEPLVHEEDKSTERAAKALLPEWAGRDRADLEADGEPGILPVGASWEHLADQSDDIKDESSGISGIMGRGERRSVWETLMSEKSGSESPTSIIQNSDMSLRDKGRQTLRNENWDSPIERLRSLGLSFAEEKGQARSPVFSRANVGGASAHDFPLPGTSFAVMGLRGSFGRVEVDSASIESDRLFYDKKDLRHAGTPHVRSSPLNIDQARGMKPGERFKISAERSVLAETGIKYTLTPLPGTVSGALYDVGPAGQVDVTVAVEGETSVEIVRGFNSDVALIVSARDERAAPGKDKTWQASVGAFFDASILEYLGENFRRMVRSGTEEKLYDLEDKKRNADLRITPYADRFNEAASASVAKRQKDTEGRVTLYEVKLDLDKPQARKVFKELTGHTGQREIDFSSLADLPDDSGVEVLRNHIRQASVKSVESSFRAFGFEKSTKDITEFSEQKSNFKPENKRQRNVARVVKNASPSGMRESTTIGRVSTHQSGDESKTGVGFGWQLSAQNKAMSAHALEEILSFAKLMKSEGESAETLERLRDAMGALPQRRFLGMARGKKDVGETQTDVRIELNSKATETLFALLKDDKAREDLWSQIATSYAAHNKLEDIPEWPVKGLNDKGVFGRMKRTLPSLTSERRDFLAARSALVTLEEAATQSDPYVAAKHLSRAFQNLDLGVAAAILNAARKREGEEGSDGVSVEVNVEGAKVLAEQKPADDKPAATSAADTSRG